MADIGEVIGLIKSLGGGGGSVDPAVIESAVSDWLDEHPEATTTVQDGSISTAKLDSHLKEVVDNVNLKVRGGSVTITTGYENKYWSAVDTLASGFKHTDVNVEGVGGTLTYKVVNTVGVPFGFIVLNDAETNFLALDRTVGEHTVDITGAKKIKLNFYYADTLENGFTINYAPLAPQYRIDYLQQELLNGYEIVEWGDTVGYVNSNGSVTNQGYYSYKTIENASRYTRIVFNLGFTTSNACIVTKLTDGTYESKTAAESGDNVYEVPKNADTIYLNFYNQQYRGVYHLYKTIAAEEKYPLKTFVTKGDESGYINGSGEPTGGFRHTTLNNPGLVKAVRFTAKQSAGAPAVVWKKDNGWTSFTQNGFSSYPYECFVFINGADEVDINWFGPEYCESFEVFYEPDNDDVLSIFAADLTNVLNKPYDFDGKTALWFGDSITVGYVTIDSVQTVTTENFVKKFSEAVGLTSTNNAQGGATMYDRQGQTQDIPAQIESATLNTDFVFIAGGTNDQAEDITPAQFESALDDICTYLKANYTGEVIFITPIGRLYFNKKNHNINEYRRLITEYAIMNGYSVVDGSKFNFPEIQGQLCSYLISDGTHPTLAGYEHYAKMLRTVLC